MKIAVIRSLVSLARRGLMEEARPLFLSQPLMRVFSYLVNNSTATASEIMEKTGLPESSVHRSLNLLRDLKILKEVGLGDGAPKGGPKPMVWKLRKA